MKKILLLIPFMIKSSPRSPLQVIWVAGIFLVFSAELLAATEVGYVNLDLVGTNGFVSVPLLDPDPTTAFIRGFVNPPPDGFRISISTLPGTNFDIFTFTAGVWRPSEPILLPGDGAIYQNDAGEHVQLIFSGQVVQVSTNPIPAGLSIKAPIVPLSGIAPAGAKLKLSPFDNLYFWTNGQFQIFTYLPTGGWAPKEPSFTPGDAFFIRAAHETNWVINLPVNN